MSDDDTETVIELRPNGELREREIDESGPCERTGRTIGRVLDGGWRAAKAILRLIGDGDE